MLPERMHVAERPGHWPHTLLVGGGLLLAYGLLLDPRWTPGGDSEFYVAAARNVLRGEGYVYNGKPVLLAPPGWPYVLAGVFAVSPTFLAAKLVNVACMVISAMLAHRVLLRLARPTVAGVSAALAGMLAAGYPLTMWLHSDPLATALGWAATLGAFKVAEATSNGTRFGWLAAVLLAGAAAVVVRYAAVFAWLPPAAVLLGAAWRGRHRRVVFGTLAVLAVAGAAALAAASVETGGGPTDAEDELPDVLDNGPASRPTLWLDRLNRLAGAGRGPAWLLAYPARFAGAFPGGEVAVSVAGLALLALLGVTAWRRGGVWWATLAYVALLAVIWPNPNARYLVPIAPLLIAGVWLGLERLPAGRKLGVAFVAALVVVNVPMYAVDVRVQRSGDYYARYEAGRLAPFLDALAYIESRGGVGDGELAVSERYENLGRMRFSKTGTREAVLLLDREVVVPFDVYSFEPGGVPAKLIESGKVLPGGFREWAERRGIRYYLYQRPAVPWRLWHFRVPARLHDALGGPPSDGRRDGWVLYSADDGFAEPVDVPTSDRRVTRVPGLRPRGRKPRASSRVATRRRPDGATAPGRRRVATRLEQVARRFPGSPSRRSRGACPARRRSTGDRRAGQAPRLRDGVTQVALGAVRERPGAVAAVLRTAVPGASDPLELRSAGPQLPPRRDSERLLRPVQRGMP